MALQLQTLLTKAGWTNASTTAIAAPQAKVGIFAPKLTRGVSALTNWAKGMGLQPDIRPAGQRPDLSPVFSFNAEGLWQGVGSIRANGDPLTRLSRWREVLQKARTEGFV